jgi:hypothetical protein
MAFGLSVRDLVFFLPVGRGVVTAGTMIAAFPAPVFVEAFGVLPGMAFTGDPEEGETGKEQSDSFHRFANLPAFARLFNFLFRNRGS